MQCKYQIGYISVKPKTTTFTGNPLCPIPTANAFTYHFHHRPGWTHFHVVQEQIDILHYLIALITCSHTRYLPYSAHVKSYSVTEFSLMFNPTHIPIPTHTHVCMCAHLTWLQTMNLMFPQSGALLHNRLQRFTKRCASTCSSNLGCIRCWLDRVWSTNNFSSCAFPPHSTRVITYMCVCVRLGNCVKQNATAAGTASCVLRKLSILSESTGFGTESHFEG